MARQMLELLGNSTATLPSFLSGPISLARIQQTSANQTQPFILPRVLANRSPS